MQNSAGEPVPRRPLPSGEMVPVLGQGTWNMGNGLKGRRAEVAALRLGLDLGMTLIDTAEMYANGGAEEVVAEAITGRRNEVFLVSKVLPSNASRQGTVAACERSLRRLGTDRIDLYLLHWRGRFPMAETVDALETLVSDGKIRYWGVSNFDTEDMEELTRLTNGAAAATNQVLYNLTRRGIEYDLVPWCAQRRIPLMAYSPIEQGRMLGHPVLQRVAGRPEHVRENRAALDLHLTDEDVAELGHAFPAPTRKVPLEVI